MRTSIRSFTFGSALLLLGGAMAQSPYAIYVSGQLEGCTGGATVTVQTMPGTEPAQTLSVPVGADCSFQTVLNVSSSSGGVFAWSTCGNGTVTADSAAYAFNNPMDTTSIVLSLACGDSAGACQACITVAQDSSFMGVVPFSAQFTSCSTGGTPPYTNVWLMPDGTISLDADPSFLFSGPGAYGVCLQSSDATGCTSVACDTVYVGDDGTINPPSTQPCQAGFWTLQAYTDTSNGGGMVAPIPNEVWVWNLSTGNTGIDAYAWDFGDGSTSSEAYPTHTYDGPGPWVLCLTITSGNCTDMYCDSVSVDADGFLNGMVTDGHGAVDNHRSGGFTLNVIQQIPTGITEIPAFADLRTWPNPAIEVLNMAFNNRIPGVVPVTVMDASGRTVIAESHSLALGANTIQLNTRTLGPGLYLVRIGNDAHSVSKRFLKVR